MAGMNESRILLIEDDAQIARLISADLQDASLPLDWESTGQQGLRHFHAVRPLLLILDLSLPDIDGLDLCAQVRRHDRPDADSDADRACDAARRCTWARARCG